MKSLRLHLTALALLVAFAFGASPADAQTAVNCAPATPCVNGTGPYNTTTGDKAADAFGKVNANFNLVPSELFSTHILTIAHGGTGAATLAAANLPVFSGGITSGHCVEWLNATTIEDSGAGCGSGGSTAFSALTGSTNVTAAMLVGTGASLGTTGSGTISASGLNSTALGTAQSWTAAQTFNNSDFLLLGSSTGATTFTSANAGASNFTLTFPAATDTVVTLAATQTLTNKSIAASEINSGQLAIANGGTGATTLAGANIPVFSGAITSGHCVEWLSSTVIEDAGAACGSGGSTAFSALTGSTNTTAAMVVGTGASLGVSGSGTITATAAPVSGLTGLGTGVATFLATPSSANLAAAVTGETGTGAVVFATSPALVTPALGTPASGVATNLTGLPLSTGVTGNLPLANIATIATQTVLGNGSGSTATPVALTLSGNLVATATGLGTSQPINAQVGTTYTMLSTDAGKLVTLSNAASVAVTLPVATSGGFTAGYSFDVQNLGAGTVTITPTTSTINGTSTLAIATNQGCTVTSDGTNYQVSACTAVAGGGGSGTVASSVSGQIPVYTAATTVTGSANATLTAGAMTLGVSGTAGSLKMGNATSGTVTLQPVTGALGAVTASLPANTGTIAETNLAETFSALQTFGTSISIGGVTAAGATGTGNIVFATSPALTTPNLGTPSAATLTNATGLPISTGVSGLGAGVATFLATPSSANLATAVTGATGTGALVFGTSPTLVTPALGTPASGTLTNATGLPVGGIAAIAANTVVMNATGSTASPTAVATVTYLIDAGTTFTLGTGTGACATTSTLTGGSTVGSFLCTGTAGASTQPIVLPTAPHGWACRAADVTSGVEWAQSATSATGCTVKGAIATTSDVMVFSAIGY